MESMLEIIHAPFFYIYVFTYTSKLLKKKKKIEEEVKKWLMLKRHIESSRDYVYADGLIRMSTGESTLLEGRLTPTIHPETRTHRS